MAGGSVNQREAVSRRRWRVEVPVRAAEALVVISHTEGVLIVDDAVDFPERCVLVEASGKRAGCGLHLACETGIVGGESGIKTIHGGAVVHGQRLVSDLGFVIPVIKQTVMDGGSA